MINVSVLSVNRMLFAMMVLVCGLCVGVIEAVAEDRPPNIILIFTDDQGYQDIGCFGSPKIATPHLDQMAREGMKFTDFYVAAPICSASRAALLTGSYPQRVSLTGVLFPRHSTGLNPKEHTIAKMLKARGYATTCIGKWHLGHLKEFLPQAHGFDSYYGVPYSNDMTVDPKAAVAKDVKFLNGMTLEKMRNDKPKKNWVPLGPRLNGYLADGRRRKIRRWWR